MTNEKIKAAAEVVIEFLDEQLKDEDLDAGTVEAVKNLRAESKLTKVNLLRQLEALRKTATTSSSGAAND